MPDLYKLKDLDLFLDFSTKQMWYHGQWHTMDLTKKQLACLAYLALNINIILSHEQIFENCWESGSPSDPSKAVHNTTSKLNKYFREFLQTFDENLGDFECISNKPGVGYRMQGSKVHSISCAQETIQTEQQELPFAGIRFDMRPVRNFASCGNETTVFRVEKSSDGQMISLKVNFEKTRLRDQIPAYAGAYYLCHPSLDISAAKRISFVARSADATIQNIWVELKPEGKAWMHESFDFCVTSEYTEYVLELDNCVYPKTLKCLEEITFLFRPDSFADENSLCGQLDIGQLQIQ